MGKYYLDPSYRASGMWIEINMSFNAPIGSVGSYRASGMWIEIVDHCEEEVHEIVIPRERYVD